MCLRWNADDADGTDERRFKKGASPVTPSVVEGSHIRLNSALHEMSRQARHDRSPKINLRKSALVCVICVPSNTQHSSINYHLPSICVRMRFFSQCALIFRFFFRNLPNDFRKGGARACFVRGLRLYPMNLMRVVPPEGFSFE